MAVKWHIISVLSNAMVWICFLARQWITKTTTRELNIERKTMPVENAEEKVKNNIKI